MKLKLTIPCNLDKESMIEIFQTSHEAIDEIGGEIDKQLSSDPSINTAIKFCIDKYVDLDLLLALMLILNICILDHHMQKEMDLAFKMMSNGARMPEEVM